METNNCDPVINERVQSCLDQLASEFEQDGRQGEATFLTAVTQRCLTGPPFRLDLTLPSLEFRRFFSCIDYFTDSIRHGVNAKISNTNQQIDTVIANQQTLLDSSPTWGSGKYRVFISYKITDPCQSWADFLASGLSDYNIHAFRAHRDIPAQADWYQTLEHALDSMDAMITLVSPDYRGSAACNQEYGWARGRGVRVVSLVLGEDTSPPGIMGKYQAIKAVPGTSPIPEVVEQLVPGCTTAWEFSRTANLIHQLRYAADWATYRFAAECLSNLVNQVKFLTNTQAQQIVDIYNDDAHSGVGVNQVRYAFKNQPGGVAELPTTSSR